MSRDRVECHDCGARSDPDPNHNFCPQCGSGAVMPYQPQAASSTQANVTVAHAFDLGFEWRNVLDGHVYDGRDVGRTLTARIFDGLGVDPNVVSGFDSKADGIMKAKAEIKRALTASSTTPGSTGAAWVQFEDGKPVALSFDHREAAGCTTSLYTATRAPGVDALPAKWREIATGAPRGAAKRLRSCADELEAALAQPAQQGERDNT
jgi:hypothetical protein